MPLRKPFQNVKIKEQSDPALLWFWSRPVATDPIRPLAWEPPYALGAALEKAKRQKKKKNWETLERIPFVKAQTFKF